MTGETMTTAQAARVFGVTAAAAQDWARRGRFSGAGSDARGRWQIPAASVRQLLSVTRDLRNLSRPFVLGLVAAHGPLTRAGLRTRVQRADVILTFGNLSLDGLIGLMLDHKLIAEGADGVVITERGRDILKEVEGKPILQRALATSAS